LDLSPFAQCLDRIACLFRGRVGSGREREAPEARSALGPILRASAASCYSSGVRPTRLPWVRTGLSSCRQASNGRGASVSEPDACSFRHSSRCRPLKRSTNALRRGFPGAMWRHSTPRSSAQRGTATKVLHHAIVTSDRVLLAEDHRGQAPPCHQALQRARQPRAADLPPARRPRSRGSIAGQHAAAPSSAPAGPAPACVRHEATDRQVRAAAPQRRAPAIGALIPQCRAIHPDQPGGARPL